MLPWYVRDFFSIFRENMRSACTFPGFPDRFPNMTKLLRNPDTSPWKLTVPKRVKIGEIGLSTEDKSWIRETIPSGVARNLFTLPNRNASCN